MAASPGAKASGVAVRRLRRDLENIQKSVNPQIAVQPAEESLLEWHFVLHSLPADSPYHGGCYHGKILFPPEYPHAPPAILMVTPSGRLETDRRLCLSMTDFHPESWNPAWSVETILVGLLSFFISDAEKGYGAISTPEEQRRRLASESGARNATNAEFRALFPEMLLPEQAATSSSPPAAVSAEAKMRQKLAERRSRVEVEPGAETPLCGESFSVASEQELSETAGEKPELQARAKATSATATPQSSFQWNAGSTAAAEDVVVELRDVPLLATAGNGETNGTEESPVECWICRDTDTTEALIQPCACRGSMSSVHASCVEQWIRHHRRNAVNDEVPCCSVCHQTYCGQEVRPGVGGFVRHVFSDAMQQLLRTVVLVLLLVGYQGAAEGPKDGLEMPMVLRVVLIALFGAVTLHKALLLAVSLPPHRPPPQNPHIQHLFVSDYRKLAMHIAEAFATMAILCFWFLCDTLSLPFFLPFLGAALVPIVKIFCWRNPSMACVGNCLKVTLSILLAPFIVTAYLIHFVYMNPHRVAHPLDAGLHILVAVAVVPMCLICESNVALVVLWGLHCLLAAVGLIEQHFVKRWQWKEGNSWWFALQLTALSAYTANALCEFPKGIGEPDNTNSVVRLVSTLWLALVCGLSVSTNWALCVSYYRTWQHRHGTFTLQTRGEVALAADGVADSAGGRVAPVGAEAA